MDHDLFEDLNRMDEQGAGPEEDLAQDIAFALIDLAHEDGKVSEEVVKEEIKRSMEIVYADVIEKLKEQGFYEEGDA